MDLNSGNKRMRPIRPLATLPTFVRETLVRFPHQSWLVGSGAHWLIEESKPFPKDFDLLLDPQVFQDACVGLKDPIRVNSFGGLKILTEPSIDVIPLTLSEFIARCDGDIAVGLRKIIRWNK